MRYNAKRDKFGHFIPIITSRIKICQYCGKEWDCDPRNFARNKFCSDSCASKSHPSGRTGKVGGQHQKDMVRLKLSGKNHWNWAKNRTKALENHRIRGLVEIKNWRNKIFIRDNYTCQSCKQHGGYLEAHHIKSWAKYPKLRFIVSNGITLCRSCHLKTFKHK